MSYKRISPIAITEGGTNATSMTNTDGVVYYDGTKLNTTTVGTSGQLLTSNGAAMAPTFQALSTPAAACAFFVWKKNATQTVTHGTVAVVTWDTTDINNGSVITGNTFVAPTSGKLYYLSTSIAALWTLVGDAIGIYKNGSQIAYSSNSQAVSADYINTELSIIVSLNSGDVIDVRYLNQQANSSTIANDSIYITWFMGYQLT